MEIKYVGGVAHPLYRKKERERKITRFLETANLIKTKSYLIDVDNMFKRRFMCCSKNCDFYVHRKKSNNLLFDDGSVDWVDKGCCYNGSLEIPKDLEENIDKHLDGILEFCDPVCRDHIVSKGWKCKIGKEYVGVDALPLDNRCLFTTIGKDFIDGESGDMPLCALHAYALSKGFDIWDFKPFECILYPLDFIEIDGKILITSIDCFGQTQGFLRWNDVHLAQGCQHKYNNGLPMYEYAKDVIIRVLGEKAYKTLDKLYKKGGW